MYIEVSQEDQRGAILRETSSVECRARLGNFSWDLEGDR